jgi:hypothetical protein
MAITAQRTVTIVYSGGINSVLPFSAAENADSPGVIDVRTLTLGNNVITPPSSGVTPKAVTIIQPSGNTAVLTLKGTNADTGVALHTTDPTTIALNSTTSVIVLSASTTVEEVTLVWT